MLDIAIRDTILVDGTGAPAYTGDVGITGNRIENVGSVGVARLDIKADGLVCAPGFIDIHAHSDFTLLVDGRANSALCQGVTTHVCGNCGISAFPVGGNGLYFGALESARLRQQITPEWDSAAGYFRTLEHNGIGLNTAFFVGHGAIRHMVMGDIPDTPTPSQMTDMKSHVNRQMEQGTLGLSTGLTYVPGSFASTDEIAALAAITAPQGGIYVTHMRNYTAAIMEALEEAIAIGRKAGVPVHASHITPCPPAIGSAQKLLDRIDRAQAEGQDVTAETEFYPTGSTALKALLPPKILIGGDHEMLNRLRDPCTRQQMWREITVHGSELGGSTKTVLMQRGQWHKLWLGNCHKNTELTGLSFAEIGRSRNTHPFDVICDILIEEDGRASFFGEDKATIDIDTLARGTHCGLGSDGFALAADGPLAEEQEHPRCYGGFAYLMRTLVRERRVLNLEQLVQRVTNFPATRLRFLDRGQLAAGMHADVVVFDPEQLTDKATFAEPNRYCRGVSQLFVNGTAVIRDSQLTGALPGKVLRRNAATIL